MRNKRLLFYCFVFLLLVILGGRYLLPAMASFLLVKDDLKLADVIVVLGGDDDRRVKQAVALYQQGFSKFLIMSGTDRDHSMRMVNEMKSAALNAGVPADKILLEPQSQHTYQHPVFVKPIMLAHGFKSAIIVSSPYHMRRVAMLFDREFRGTGIKLIYYPSRDSYFTPDNWWKNKYTPTHDLYIPKQIFVNTTQKGGILIKPLSRN